MQQLILSFYESFKSMIWQMNENEVGKKFYFKSRLLNEFSFSQGLASTKFGLIDVYIGWKPHWIFGCVFILQVCRIVLAIFNMVFQYMGATRYSYINEWVIGTLSQTLKLSKY
ncbi:hypothetical protein B5C00_01255 [Staphylococcus delphini]|uniref:Uncharacterized protein n=1 Tax=Staphylococcus delphini TaxID=53344 RepID=A0AAX0QV79_9STAP|nr:hypothetical protein B5C00_01255 [Staphylococcus delphini]PCF51076.1 hypothetical protein B5C07_05520 [Staphylococcus delphini]PNZ89274.1 hypothetical protein CD148_12255 [Staphylococcus delphini]RIZ55517.1 hypothetical protein CDL68_03775 [Staphylococcus delphini]